MKTIKLLKIRTKMLGALRLNQEIFDKIDKISKTKKVSKANVINTILENCIDEIEFI